MNWNSTKSMLKAFKNKYFFLKLSKQTKKRKVGKGKKGKLLLLIHENIDDRKLLNIEKLNIPTEYRQKGIKCFKN